MLVHMGHMQRSGGCCLSPIPGNWAAIKADLLRLGADAACMSGSGSSVVGVFGRAAVAHAGQAVEALRKGKRRVFMLSL